MSQLIPVNKKARRIEQTISAGSGDVEALQSKASPGRIYYPMGCTLNFTPGWEIDNSGGTAGFCQPVERDLFDFYLGCGWPAPGPGHLNNPTDCAAKYAPPPQCPRTNTLAFAPQRLR